MIEKSFNRILKYLFLYITDHPSQSRKQCLSPISLVQMYSPDLMNGTIKNNPIYRSSPVLTDKNNEDEHQHQHQHQHHHEQQHEHHSNEDEDYSISNIQITPAAFMNMCPALLVQIEQGSCAEQEQHYDDIPQPSPSSSSSLPSMQPKEGKEISSFGKS